ncbi:MAG TPA: hypothetical protein H9717_13075 [Candidatus Eisenbergiella merdipullorum]|uniref:Uncharacterized protein n=1 Tax=Candidatus Eisenbergiella merdipullorum TaxID=2838553 RepID=A0A9D2L133_9FIRM|nr:hypothetical protein [Candidatus Eisenbergiella merdipullorum]
MAILDEISDCVISGRLQETFLSDTEYQELSEKQEKASEECYGRVPKEYHDVIEEMTDCQNECAGRLIEMAYQQGMIDCAKLLLELGLIKDGTDQGGWMDALHEMKKN